MSERASVAERVAAGAALLDEKVPGWVERVDTDGWGPLSVRRIDNCVSVRATGAYDYRAALRLLGMEWTGDCFEPAAALGFDWYGEESEDFPLGIVAELDAAWRALVRERLGVSE